MSPDRQLLELLISLGVIASSKSRFTFIETGMSKGGESDQQSH